MEYKIKPKREHVIITDLANNFICSCDNYEEAKKEIEKMEAHSNEFVTRF